MTVTERALFLLEQHWAVRAVGEVRCTNALRQAQILLLRATIGNQLSLEAPSLTQEQELVLVAGAYEVAAVEGIDALLYQNGNDQQKDLADQAQAGAYRAFDLRRVLGIPSDPAHRILFVLHLAALAYCGDRSVDLRRWFKEHAAETVAENTNESLWNQRLLLRIYDCWVRLLRKNGWDDLNAIPEIITGLRQEQARYEPQLLNSEQARSLPGVAFNLIALYHWARATELLALYMLQGQPSTIEQELDHHFEASRDAAAAAGDMGLEVLVRWLHVAARRMVFSSVWWAARAIKPLTQFIENITKNRGLFEFLSPQQAALHDPAFLNPTSRSIVVDLPTSGGKTMLAQIRILQALNQSSEERGWVAYVAPTRALVAQITRRLRTDFGPIGIRVEQLTAAVDIDSFEQDILEAGDDADAFQVLVATPEKLHMVILNKRTSRPLMLIVLDEAQNIEDEERGLRFELLLATIKSDCPTASFLLLMPYVPNADRVARWLAPTGTRPSAISIGTSAWQPNERLVGMFSIQQEGHGDWSLRFETLITSPRIRGLKLEGMHQVGSTRPLDIPYHRAKTQTNQAGAMAKVFSERGTSVVVARRVDESWKLASTVAATLGSLAVLPSEIALVQRFLATEVSANYELIDLLGAGVGVHNSSLSEETRSLMEWLAENGHLKVLCATTGISQGINFPVSSVFLASLQLPSDRISQKMSSRQFWNLAGRAGRIDQDSVGVVGLAAGNDPNATRAYIAEAVGDLVSRLVSLLDKVEELGQLNNLSHIIEQDQWRDFRIYIAHLWNERRDLDRVVREAETLLRNTFGYSSLQAGGVKDGRVKARALLDATKKYASNLATKPETALLADSTGFAPEGVQTALSALHQLEKKLTIADWTPTNLFGAQRSSILPQLIGVMMRIPELKSMLEGTVSGPANRHLADVAQAWVMGRSIEAIASQYFMGVNTDPAKLTEAIGDACYTIYRVLGNAGTWGLSALTQMPTSGINFEALSEDEQRVINNLPAMLYHGVRTDGGIIMRMNNVPRTVAEPLGARFLRQTRAAAKAPTMGMARSFLRELRADDWDQVVPNAAAMSGNDYRLIWSRLSGEPLQ